MESVWYHNIVTKMLIILKKYILKKIVSSQISLFHLYKFLKDIVWNKTFMKIIHTWLSKLKFLNHTSIKLYYVCFAPMEGYGRKFHVYFWQLNCFTY